MKEQIKDQGNDEAIKSLELQKARIKDPAIIKSIDEKINALKTDIKK